MEEETINIEAAEALFRPVTPGRISGEIIEQIKSAIFAGRLGPGDRLPSERELSERFRVSRVTVRDALRVLEASGLIEIRVGARGGAVVTVPQIAPVGERIATMLLLSDLQPGEVTEARRILELGSVPLICERADDQDIKELHDICDRAEEALARGTFHMGLSAEFHIRLARCAHNDAIQLLVDPMRGPLLTSLLQAKEVAPEMGVEGFREHRAVVEAIAEGDVERTRRILADHLDRTAARLESEAAKDSSPMRDNAPGGGTADLFTPVTAGRVSGLIVDQIRRLILTRQLLPGDRLPAERDLAERFGVSRVTVRDALRVLEAQGIVTIRVGAAGGAFVTAPSSAKVGEGISTLLRLATLRPDHVAEARLVMELGAAALAVEAATDADLDGLRQLCDLAERQYAEGHYDVALSSRFHIALAAAAHNTALRLLTELFTGPLSMKAIRAGEPAHKAHGQTVAEHRRIVDALAGRDLAALQKALIDHLVRGTAIDAQAAQLLAPGQPARR